MKRLPSNLAWLAIALLLAASKGHAGFGTTVPVTAELATSIATSLFPQTLALSRGSLFVSDPVVLYTGQDGSAPSQASPRRLRLQLNVQSLQRQADHSLKAGPPVQAELSGEIGYDREAVQILLFNPRIESLTFDPSEPRPQELRADLYRQWGEQVTNPMRVDVPLHPFLLPFRQGIRDISLEDEAIVVEVWFE